MSKKKQTQWVLNSTNDTYYTQEPKQKCKQKWYSWACIAAEALHYLCRYDNKAPPFFPFLKKRRELSSSSLPTRMIRFETFGRVRVKTQRKRKKWQVPPPSFD